MTREILILLDKIIKEVANLSYGEINKVDDIWDRSYDKFVELVVDENCNDKASCQEEVIHDEIADIRVLYYEKIEEYSYECCECGKKVYGKNTLKEDRLCHDCLR